MNKIFKFIAGLFFGVFIVAVAIWTASLTLAEVKEILPSDPITPYFALMLFDGGAVAWLGAWLFLARGIPQRGITLVMLVVDLLGVALLSAGRLFMGGQSLTEAPESLGLLVVYGLALSTLLNLAALYAYHIADPDNIESIETALLEDTLRDEALSQAKATIEGEAQQLGAILAARATGRLKYRLGLPMGDTEAAAVIADNSQPAADPAPMQILSSPIKQASPSRVNPLARWIVATGRNIKKKLTPAPAGQAVIYESTTQPAPQIVPTQQPAPQVLQTDANELHYHPMGGLQPADQQQPEQPAADGERVFTKGMGE